METEQWVDRERAIWKVLPLHPQPQLLESFTSYLIRLAEANGLQSIRELVALVGSPQRRRESLYNSPDYPAPSFYAGLAHITGCPEERLQQTTFDSLVRRFGRSMYPHALHQFRRREPGLLFALLSCMFSRVRPSFLLAALAIPGAPWMRLRME